MSRLVSALFLAGLLLPQQPATNYDEANVPAYRLPPLLVSASGERVRDAAGWVKRREEIRALLESQMFGRAPARPATISFETVSIDKAALAGKAVRKEVAIRVDGRTLNLLV